jgi:putative cardiolipin synthase
MHTKSFTADNEVTIVGGRNIGDEYYGARHDINFGDVDVLGIGPVVNEVSTVFDSFWNNRLSLPVQAVAGIPEDSDKVLNELRDTINQYLDESENTQYAAAVTADFEKYLAAEEDIFTWAPYVLAYDSPEKADKKLAKSAPSIVDPLVESIMKAQEQLVVVSPYFVPRKKGLQLFQELRDRGIEVSIVTNSLAANNHTLVHAGYAPSRKPLLEMGVRIFEVRTTASTDESKKTGNEDALATLHTKVFIVDSDELFVGSFNWDPRSVNLNTEIGVIIESTELTAEMLIRLERGEANNAYEVVLNDIGQLRWVDRSGDQEVILSKEPDTTWSKRTSAVLMELLPVRGQL